jgi:hypothetical protein
MRREHNAWRAYFSLPLAINIVAVLYKNGSTEERLIEKFFLGELREAYVYLNFLEKFAGSDFAVEIADNYLKSFKI